MFLGNYASISILSLVSKFMHGSLRFYVIPVPIAPGIPTDFRKVQRLGARESLTV